MRVGEDVEQPDGLQQLARALAQRGQDAPRTGRRLDDQRDVEQHRREHRDASGQSPARRANASRSSSSAQVRVGQPERGDDPRVQLAGVTDDRAVQQQLGTAARMPRRVSAGA